MGQQLFKGESYGFCVDFGQTERGIYRKKAPARRRERRKRDNEQELKLHDLIYL
jgi:hypothetical protein